jgi:hypothetical protein
MSASPVVVYTAPGQLQAQIVKGLLEAQGIPAQLSGEGAGAAYGLTVGLLGLVEILVPANRAAEAEKLIAAMESGELGDEPSPG